MKKIFLALALLCGLYVPFHVFSLDDVKNAAHVCAENIVMLVVGFLQYLLPAEEGIKSYFIWAYMGVRGAVGKMIGLPPLSTYDYVIERAKNNPLEAIGAVTLVVLALWSMYIVYRTVYRLLYWLLVTRRS